MPFGNSVRGQCRTERRRDRWFCNPKGIVSSSPGLPSPRGYPGLAPVRFSTPTGLCPIAALGPQPRWGWPTPPAFPRVASRTRQPWASGRNPFGIHLWNFRKALGLKPNPNHRPGLVRGSARRDQGAGWSVSRDVLARRMQSASNQMGSMARKRWKFFSAFHFW